MRRIFIVLKFFSVLACYRNAACHGPNNGTSQPQLCLTLSSICQPIVGSPSVRRRILLSYQDWRPFLRDHQCDRRSRCSTSSSLSSFMAACFLLQHKFPCFPFVEVSMSEFVYKFHHAVEYSVGEAMNRGWFHKNVGSRLAYSRLKGLEAFGSTVPLVRPPDRTVVRTSVQVHLYFSASSELVFGAFRSTWPVVIARDSASVYREMLQKTLGEMSTSVQGVLRQIDERMDGDASHMQCWHPLAREHHHITASFLFYSRVPR